MLGRQIKHAVRRAITRSPLAPVLKSLLARGSALDPARKLGREVGWEQAAQRLISEQGRAALEDGALLDALSRDINRDIDTELLLTAVRRELLLGATDLTRELRLVPFVCALIRQCINNEYVWFVSAEEKERVAALLAAAPGGAIAWQSLALLALYRPLYELLGLGAGSGRRAISGETPGVLKALIDGYLAEHEEEMAIKKSIESFGTIENPTSRAVAAFYEAYPYPRWINIEMPAPGSRRELVRQFYSDEELKFLDRPFDVLVAGCGTGRKALQLALGFGENARVWATDLSRASLAYASRMARKHQIGNIRFLQIDILDLPKLERKFDIIECTGVLVCVAEPLKSWRVLLDVLKPEGLMHISLYSELARRDIVRLRREYEPRIAELSDDEIRAFRRRWMREIPDTLDALPTPGDFFDLSRCKDLLFHPMEHRYTIPQVRQFLDALGLEFRGFMQPRLIGSQYWTAFPPGEKRRDLDAWWSFEQANPDAFADLYEIWCRRPGSGGASGRA
jgi:SAM-dependent methyltransferase